MANLQISQKLASKSDRVKCIDIHSTEPLLLVSLHTGSIHLWNHEKKQLIKTLEICDKPVRAAKFVDRKDWIVTGSDDGYVRVFNQSTLELLKSFKAHTDYIRCIVVHPTQPFILTCGDDMYIKLWNWDESWKCQKVYEGHNQYIMQIALNSTDTSQFASASIDGSLKLWQLDSENATFTLGQSSDSHKKGVNCVCYYKNGDNLYLISGADDNLLKIWDCESKVCVKTLEGHLSNVTAVAAHPKLPIIMSASEDGTVHIWDGVTFCLEKTLNYGLERAWTIACRPGSNDVGVGYDQGLTVVTLETIGFI